MKKKSDGTRSRLYGRCGSNSHQNPLKISLATREEWAEVLSQWKRISRLSYPGRFLGNSAPNFLKAST